MVIIKEIPLSFIKMAKTHYLINDCVKKGYSFNQIKLSLNARHNNCITHKLSLKKA